MPQSNRYSDSDESVSQEAVEGGARLANKLRQNVRKQYKDKLHDGEKHESTDELSPYSKKLSKRTMQRELEEESAKKGKKKAAEKTGELGKTISDKIEDAIDKLGEYIASHPKELAIILVLGLLVLLIAGGVSSCTMMFAGGQNITAYTSYTAKDRVIKQVESDYKDLEDDIQDQIDNIESAYTGYDRYDYNLGTIGHNPHALAAILTVVYEDYSRRDVQDYLEELIDWQYSLWVRRKVETRTRTVTKYHYVTYTREVEKTGYRWEGRRLVSYTYTVEEEYDVLESYEEDEDYEYYILKVNLSCSPLEDIVEHLGFTDEQLERYEILMETQGNKPDIFD